jgi:hypothetical protein
MSADLTLTLTGATLTAADGPSRRVAGVIVPYGIPGYTSAGLVTVRAGAITIPPDLARVRLTYGHDRDRPIGVAAELIDTAHALTGAFLIARTDLGDQYLAELDPITPIRDGLSIDLTDVELEASEVVGGTLVAVGAVSIPAYTAARAARAAHDDRTPNMPETPVSAAPASADPPTVGAAPAPLTASEPDARPLSPARGVSAAPRSALAEVVARITAARLDGASALRAALADITPAGNGAGNESAGLMTQALGELWKGLGYVPRYTPLVAGGPLTGTKAESFTWNPPPVVADYTGNKAEVPSNAAKLVLSSAPAQRLAGAHDIDRIYTDLGTADVLASYWARMTESLAVQIDARALGLIQTAAGTPLTTATTAMAAIIQGSLAVSAVATPTYALVSSDLVEAMALTPAIDAPTGGGFPLPPIVAGPALPANTVIVGARNAARLLTFSPPIRVEAVNIPNGGIDAGLFSYTAGIMENSAAVVAYTVTPPIARSSK